jgi:signal transduction histidine kinase
MSDRTPSPFWRLLAGARKYQLELKHLVVLFFVLIVFQFVVVVLSQRSANQLFLQAQHRYQQDTAERIANLTATSIELLLESKGQQRVFSDAEKRQIVQDFNIIFSQQLLDKNVQAVSIVLEDGAKAVAVDDGAELFEYLLARQPLRPDSSLEKARAVAMYRRVRDTLMAGEQTCTIVEGDQVFHVFIPFVPRGEFQGAVYMRNAPDLSFITRATSVLFDETTLVYSGLIIAGLIATFFVSSRSVRERNRAQQALFDEQKRHLAEQIHHEKEALFTKRIYHTHHKAEKIGGFIKEDLRQLTAANMDDVRSRINHYASFIARVIYDMKWYDPPIQTIRGPMFRTDVNAVIRFLVANVFQRVSVSRAPETFDLQLDPAMPPVTINEYVLWEVLEPIIQNSFDHAGREELRVRIQTSYDPATHVSQLVVEDNGRGFLPEMLVRDENGVRTLFHDRVSTNAGSPEGHSGYGCYIAHEIATQRCGWQLDAENAPGGGARFVFLIPHASRSVGRP